MVEAREIEKNQAELQVYRLEQMQSANAKATPQILAPIETALALAYIARELVRKS
jgi:hypothetical protein